MPKMLLILAFILCLGCGFTFAADGFRCGNIYDNKPDATAEEAFEDIVVMPALGEAAVERIFSEGQASPEDFWYDQDWDEWVMILAGGAEIELKENAQVVRMGPGDWAYLPANCVHRVKSTEKNTTWLAVHVGRPASDDASGHNHQ